MELKTPNLNVVKCKVQELGLQNVGWESSFSKMKDLKAKTTSKCMAWARRVMCYCDDRNGKQQVEAGTWAWYELKRVALMSFFFYSRTSLKVY